MALTVTAQPLDYHVATIQTNFNSWERRIIAPRFTEDGSVLLDMCPAGTQDVHSFYSVKQAAEFMGVSESTVRRHSKRVQDDEEEFDDWYSE